MSITRTMKKGFSFVGMIYDHSGCTPTLTLPRLRGWGLRGTGGQDKSTAAKLPPRLRGGMGWGRTKITPANPNSYLNLTFTLLIGYDGEQNDPPF